ncbi:MAG: DUF4388 domain-containing protein [Thermoanaerobaculia bacterium]
MEEDRRAGTRDDAPITGVDEEGPASRAGAAGRFRTLASSPRLLVLRNEAPVPPWQEEGASRILMAGEILLENTVLEVVNLILSARWTGALHVHGRDAHRVLGLERGILRFAQSDDPEDRLNKVLFRLGVLSPAQSEEVERGPKADRRFGESLVKKGLVEERALFGYLERQMAEIFLSASLEEEGYYVFTVGEGWSSDAPVTAYVPMQQLVFDAADRVDRFQRFRRLVPDESFCPAVRPGVEVTRLEPRERRVLGLCDGSRSVRDLARESWLGRFGAMEVTYDLLTRDYVELRAPRQDLESTARRLVGPCAAALGEITAAAGRNGDLKRLHREIARWVQESSYQRVLGPALSERLAVDPCQIAGVLEELQVRDRVEIVEHALRELVAFALFAASFSLSREEERELKKRVAQHLDGTGPTPPGAR